MSQEGSRLKLSAQQHCNQQLQFLSDAFLERPNILVAQGWYKVYFNDITGAYFFTPTTSPYDK